MCKLLSCPFPSSHLQLAPCSIFPSIIPGDSVLSAGLQQDIVFLLHFFYSRKGQNFPFSVTVGEYCPVLQLCPTQSHTSTPCARSNVVFGQRGLFPPAAGWIQPSWQLFLGWNLHPAGLSGAALSGGMGLCVPRMFWTMNWFYWFLSHCWFVFPVSTNRQEEQHHISCSNVEISVISLCIDLPPSALGFFSFYPFLGSFPDSQKSRNLSRTKDSVAILPLRKEHFPVSSCFPSLLPCPFQRRRLEIGSLLSLSSAWRLTQWNWTAWGEIVSLIQKMKLLKAFLGLEMCGLKSPVFGYWCVKPWVWPPDYSLEIIEINKLNK